MKLPTDKIGFPEFIPERDRQKGDYSSTILTLGFVCMLISIFLTPLFKSPAPFLVVVFLIIVSIIFDQINKNRRKN